jgi:hypothetical protein
MQAPTQRKQGLADAVLIALRRDPQPFTDKRRRTTSRQRGLSEPTTPSSSARRSMSSQHALWPRLTPHAPGSPATPPTSVVRAVAGRLSTSKTLPVKRVATNAFISP